MKFADNPQARSVAHAALGYALGWEWDQLTLDEGSALITDLIAMADDEGMTDLSAAAHVLGERLRPGDNWSGYVRRYASAVVASNQRKGFSK